MNAKIVITGGGTGGHVFPALAIAEEMRSRGWEVLYVGTSHGMEAKLVPEAGIPFFTVKTGAVKNQSFAKIFSTFYQLAKGIFWSFSFLKEKNPNAVLGVGGYVSVPICVAAFILRKPLYLQEQNSSVGIANRFLGRLAKQIFLGFPQAISYFNPKKCLTTGNPLRSVFYHSEIPPYNSKNNFLLVIGGSQGARAINEGLLNCLDRLHSSFPELKIFHQTGQRDFDAVSQRVGEKYKTFYEHTAFIRNVTDYYGKASLVVSRSGALTISELIQVGRPAIFVPFPRKGQNDQLTNAYLVQENGGGVVVEQGPEFNERFEKALFELLNSNKLDSLAKSYSKLQHPNPLKTIGDHLQTNS